MEAELEKLEYNLGGVRDMKRLPAGGADHRPEDRGDRGRRGDPARDPDPRPRRLERRPDGRRVPDPGNDDSMRSCELVVWTVGEAVNNAADQLSRGGGQAPRRGRGKAPPRGRGKRRREEEERARKEAEEAAAQAGRPGSGGRRPASPRSSAQRHPSMPPTGAASSRRDQRRPNSPGRAGRTDLMAVGAKDVKSLRDRTGAAMMDCKAALEEAGGDQEEAVEMLPRQGPGPGGQALGRGDQRRGRRAPTSTPAARSAPWSRSVRDRLRRPQRRLPGVRPRGRDPHRRAASRSTSPPTRSPMTSRDAERARVRGGRRAGRASPTTWIERDRRRPARQVGQGHRPARAGARAAIRSLTRCQRQLSHCFS